MTTERMGLVTHGLWRLVAVLSLHLCLVVAGGERTSRAYDFHELQKRTLAAVDPTSTKGVQLAALFKKVETEMAALAGQRYGASLDQDLVAASKRLEAALTALKEEVGIAVVVAVLSTTSGEDEVRQVAYRCLSQHGDRYGFDDVDALSQALILTHKDSLLSFVKGPSGRYVPDHSMRDRLDIILGNILGLTGKHRPAGFGPSDLFEAEETRNWLRTVLTAALAIPANADKKDAINKALANLDDERLEPDKGK